MSDLRRFGYNVLGQFVTDGDRGQKRTAYLEYVRQHRPRVIQVMDEVALTYQTRAASSALVYQVLEAAEGETEVFHRIWNTHDWAYWRWLKVNEFCDHITMNGSISKDIGVVVLNEPDTKGDDLPDLLQWLVDVGDELADRGYRAIMGNIGPGTVETDTIESGVFEGYLRRLAEWSAADQHYGGWHEYAPICLPMGVGQWPVSHLEDPTKVQPDNWPIFNMMQARVMRAQIRFKSEDELAAQVGVYPGYWWLFRSEWFNLWAEEQGIGRHKIVLSEFGWDRMGDLAKEMPKNIYQRLEGTWGAAGYGEIRGVRTLENIWRAYWPTWSFEEALFKQLEWADGVYPENYVGMCLFCWAFDAHIEGKEQAWERLGYNLGDLTGLQAMQIAAFGAEDPPAPSPVEDEPEDEPEPEPVEDPVEDEPVEDPPAEEESEGVGCSPVAGVLMISTWFKQFWTRVWAALQQPFVQQSVKDTLMDNVPEIFKSKRFWTGLFGLVFMVIVAYWPDLEAYADTLQGSALIIVSLLIGGYAAEDYAQAKSAQVAAKDLAQLAIAEETYEVKLTSAQMADFAALVADEMERRNKAA